MAAKNGWKSRNPINPDYFCLLTPFMARAIYIFVGLIVILGGCTERLVCPAYQSAYIYDKDELRKKFSYFQEDSTPKIFTASKTKYLIAEPTPYRKKLRSLQTVPVKKVFVNVPDSLSDTKEDSVITADLDKAARSVIDSTMIVDVQAKDTAQTIQDSTYVITKDKEVRVLKYNMPDSLEFDAVNNKYVAQKPKYYIEEVGYNMEQDNYMWYLRHSLILPDVRIAKMQSGKEGKATEKKEKQGFLGFFKNLFKKKKTTDIDSAELEIVKPEGEEFDFIDTTATMGPDPQQKTSRRKEVISPNKNGGDEETVTESDTPAEDRNTRKKKKKKSDEPAEQPENTDPKKEDGDGF
jgi:hypothetical protein